MSKKAFYSVRMRASKGGLHISGAEGIYERPEVVKIVREYTERVFNHERGKADEIRLTVEQLKISPKKISSLPVVTLNIRRPETARKAVHTLLRSIGISERAIHEGYKAVTSQVTMRGAILMDIDGVRLEPDLLRGVRVTRMGITKEAASQLSRILSRHGINNNTVKEALILASKVNRHRLILGELCISDDPDYTTGYVASKYFGYVRLPHIKKKKTPYGGRVFFIAGGEVKELIKYLQTTPVLISSVKPCMGVMTLDEFIEYRARHKSRSR